MYTAPRDRTVEVLKRWSGDSRRIPDFGITLQEYWDATKETGNPSHNDLDFWQEGAKDLIGKLVTEFRKSPPYNVNITYKKLEPIKGAIKTIDSLLDASGQFDYLGSVPVTAHLTLEAHNALVQDIVARLEPILVATGKRGARPAAPPLKSATTKAVKKAVARKSSSRKDASG